MIRYGSGWGLGAGKYSMASQLRRNAVLGGGWVHPQRTTLGELRKFVKHLERWPDRADVTVESGAIIAVEFFEHAPDLMGPVESEETE